MNIEFKYSNFKWDNLITEIRNKSVVPIIGSEAIEIYCDAAIQLVDLLNRDPLTGNNDLLLMPSELLDNLKKGYEGNKGILLYDYLTYKLLSSCYQEILKDDSGCMVNTENVGFNKAAYFYIKQNKFDLRKKGTLRLFIQKEIDHLIENKNSTSLDDLVRIPFFKLYLCLTQDIILYDCINSFRILNDDAISNNSIFADNNTNQDFSGDQIKDVNTTLLYYIYGIIRAADSPAAITEEEIIQYTCQIYSETAKPAQLLNYIRGKTLLLIGCKYNDWLLGFLLRILTGTRIIDHEPKKLFSDKSFKKCQTYLTEDYQIYIDDCCSVEFIKKLAEDCIPAEGKKIEKDGVFISFHSNDRKKVERLKNSLVREGIPAWFDEDGLQVGDVISENIKDNIINSSTFLALISINNINDSNRYYMKEWDYAKKLTTDFNYRKEFILPVIIDEDIPYNHPFILTNFEGIKNKTILEPFKNKGNDSFKELVDQLRHRVRERRAK